MIYLVLILGLILRLISVNQSLWLDEAIGALAVKNLSYYDLITSFLTVDNHPPLYYLLLKHWSGIFGYSEIALRAPSIIFGLGTIYFVYLIGRKIFDSEKAGLIAAALLSTSQLHVYYSQEARMYSMAAFLAVAAFYCFLFLLGDRQKFKHWFFFSLSTTALVFTDYMPVFLLPVFFVIPLFKKKNKSWWISYAFLFLPLLVFELIWLPVFEKQSLGGKWLMDTLPGWKELAGGATFKQLVLLWMKFTLGRISLANKGVFYVISALVSIPFALLISRSFKFIKKFKEVFIWLLLPITVSYVASVFFPAFIYFRLLFILAAFYLVLTLGGMVNASRKWSALIALIILINIASCIFYYTDKFQKREMWKGAVAYVENRVTDNEIVLFSYPEPFAPYRWYEKKEDLSFGATDSIKAGNIETSIKTKKLITGVSGIYYFEYLNDLSDPERVVMGTIEENGFFEKEVIGDFNGVGLIYHFVR